MTPEEIGKMFGDALEVALRRTNDPHIAELAEQFVRKFEHTAWLGDSGEPLSRDMTNQIRATLLGGRMLLTPGRQSAVLSELDPPGHVSLARIFLDLVAEKVGEINPANPNEATLKMRISANQREPVVKHRKM